MAKKKNPEQENPPAEAQEPETEQQEETPAQEESDQEQQPQDQEPEEQEEDPAEEEQEEDSLEDPEQEPPAEQPPAQEPASDETAQLRTQLLQARGQIAAYAAGVAPGMVDDAVTLAMAEAARAGEVTEAAVAAAMESVLKRHPEWKAEASEKACRICSIAAQAMTWTARMFPMQIQAQGLSIWEEALTVYLNTLSI